MITQHSADVAAADEKEEYDCFIEKYPAYAATASLDKLRSTDYARLDEQKQVYLDYTGGGLYSASQIQQHSEMLTRGIYGNPHSSNPTSRVATQLDEGARAYILRYFNANPDDYLVIF